MDVPNRSVWIIIVTRAFTSSTPVRIPKVPQRIRSRCPGSNLQVGMAQLLGQNRAHVPDLQSNPKQCLIEAETGLDAHDEEVQGIGQGILHFVLPGLRLAAHVPSRKNPAQAPGPQNAPRLTMARFAAQDGLTMRMERLNHDGEKNPQGPGRS